MGSNTERGFSVYCQNDTTVREQGVLYKAAREIAQRQTCGKLILDLGSSDLPASRLLIEDGHQVIELDLDIFSKAGYEVCETYATNMFEGLTGHPEYLGNNHDQSESSKKRILRTLYTHLPKKVGDQLFSYQALYVLKAR